MLPREQFGAIDIYLFDQLLKGRIAPGMQIFDAGCGPGRNLVYFLREGYRVSGVDPDPNAVAHVRALAAATPSGSTVDIRNEAVEAMTFEDAVADVVISSAVLHFARDDAHFRAMLRGSWRVLRPGGLFFCRLASSVGVEPLVRPLGNGRYWLPDGSERYLVNDGMLVRWTRELGAELLDPVKTTVVQGMRGMATWVLRKA